MLRNEADALAQTRAAAQDGAAGTPDSPERRAFMQLTAAALVGGLALEARAEDVSVAGRVFDADAVAELQRQVRGPVVARGTPLYEVWRQSMVWERPKDT